MNAEEKCQFFDDKVSDRLIQYIKDSDLRAANLLVDELESICDYGNRNTEQDVLIDIGWLFIFNHDFIYPPKEPIDLDGLADRIRLLPRRYRLISYSVLAEHYILTGDFSDVLNVTNFIENEQRSSLIKSDSNYIYINLSYIYNLVGFTKLAEDYAKKAYEHATSPIEQLRSLIVFRNLRYFHSGEEESGEEELRTEITRLLTEITSSIVRAEGYSILTEAELENADYFSAKEWLEKALTDTKKNGASRHHLNLLVTKAELAIKNSEYQEALWTLEDIHGYPLTQIRDFTKVRLFSLEAKVYQYKGDFEGALNLARAEMSLSSEINRKLNDAVVADLLARYNSLEKEREIATLQQEKQLQKTLNSQQKQLILNYILGVAILTLSLLILFILFWRKRKRASHFEYIASYDQLTQVLNRRAINKIAEEKFKSSNLSDFVVAIADIDFFKAINDTYGHNIGDEVLKQFALCAKSVMRKSDYLGRWGGEEWLLLFSDAKPQDLRDFYSRLQKSLSALEIDNHTLKITFSMGAVSSSQYSNFADALNEADKLLYKAKNNGRNRLFISNGEI